MRNTKKGFTLVELLLTIAIVAILAGALLVSMSGQKGYAERTKALGELSSLVNPILMCKTDGGTINNPDAGAGGTGICNIGGGVVTTYGVWPSTASTGPLAPFGNYQAGQLGQSNWWFFVSDGSARVCCNGNSNRCAIIDNGVACLDKDLSNL